MLFIWIFLKRSIQSPTGGCWVNYIAMGLEARRYDGLSHSLRDVSSEWQSEVHSQAGRLY